MRDATTWTGLRRRPLRTLLVLVAVAAGVAVAVAVPAQEAEAASARVLLQLADPLSTAPVRLQVAAVDADGFAAPFSGRVTLAVGRTSASVPVTSETGQEEVVVPTDALRAGAATATAVLRIGGRTVRTTVPGIVDVAAAVELRGFGCGVVTPAQRRIAWQVVRLNGDPVTWPAWTPSADTFPAYVRTVQPARITDSTGRALMTRGTVVITRGTKRVAVVRVPTAARRMLFSVPWSGTVGGRFAPGTYTASIVLTDARGRTTTAIRQLLVARSSAGLCA